MSLAGYFTDLIEERRKSKTDDLLSELIRAEEEGDRLSHSELVVQSIGLLIAGFETTIGLIGNGVAALARNPREAEKLRARPELVPNAVEECLRYEGPIGMTLRVLHEDASFGDRTIPERHRSVGDAVGRQSRSRRVPRSRPLRRRAQPTRASTWPSAAVRTSASARTSRAWKAQVAIGALIARTRDLALDERRDRLGRVAVPCPGHGCR